MDKDFIEFVNKIWGDSCTLRIKVCVEFGCMYTGIRSATTSTGRSLPYNSTQRCVDFYLNSIGVGLYLPTVIIGPVV